MIREMTALDKDFYLDSADKFYHSPAVLHPVPKACFLANFKEMTEGKTYLEGYIFESDGAPCGFAVVSKTFASEVGGLCVWIEDVYVLPDYRSKGLGKEFFDFLQKKYLWKAKRFRLEVEASNEKAIRFYKRQGFTELSYKQMIKDL